MLPVLATGFESIVSFRTAVCWATESVFSRADREGGRPRPAYLPPTLLQGVSLLPFTHPRPVSQQLFSNNCRVHSIPSSYFHYSTRTTPPLPPAHQNTLRALRFPACPLRHPCVLLLLKQLSSELETEAEVTLTPLIKLISGETDAGETRPGWMRCPRWRSCAGKPPLYTPFLPHSFTNDHAVLYTIIYVQAL